ncbi:primosomal protein N' [Lipingzhangella sp. LS1_29]|uniref:Probable replication restart protein PriA n=1 Tax=Lipingzhangella rawalii TaxID=2055835 RepID=A0ABU2H3M8_9ACTN|nr:primosomal protein N' [Lipingzhangella rawalii]MDS1269454.1 primosomal protein N' [Lipingzhangella rawalii]
MFDLPRAKAEARAQRPQPRQPAAEQPVARVLVDTPLPHLDRPFDYLVPAEMDVRVRPGCRVRVRFAGQQLAGLVLERVACSEHQGRLSYLSQVVSTEVVLTPEIAALTRAVADRYAGTQADVLRLAVPPRHARVEQEPAPEAAGTPDAPSPGPWLDYTSGESFLAALRAGGAPRAVWDALPGPDWATAIGVAVATVLSRGRGAVVVVPDGRDVATVDNALRDLLGPDHHVALTADLGPAERYRRWLRVVRGQVRAAVGTRSAMFAPVHDLGLVVLWDDGSDVHCEPHAPYPHARTVLALRAHQAAAGALLGGRTRTTDTTMLIASGWANPLSASRDTVRRRAPRVRPAGDDTEIARDPEARTARLPAVALRVARAALRDGPVLVQVPRRGYLEALACTQCREPARCAGCHGPLALRSAHAIPFCRWCGRIAGEWRCPECGNHRLRAVTVGARRTAEELGRAFPSVPVVTSGREPGHSRVVPSVQDRPALVIATPGAEPVAAGGYSAALLLDGWALLGRADLRAGEEALRRWCNAAALVRAASAGGQVVVLAEPDLAPTQALVRWDPATFAERELEERRELGFPPATTMAAVTGRTAHVREVLDQLRLPEDAELLGPVSIDDQDHQRALLRVPRASAWRLAHALKTAAASRSARREEHVTRVYMDPLEVV